MAITVKLGQLCMTPGAIKHLTQDDALKAIRRHAAGDWGDVCAEDWHVNDEALVHGTRLLSVYRSETRRKFWIITEADRSLTTILLPEEY